MYPPPAIFWVFQECISKKDEEELHERTGLRDKQQVSDMYRSGAGWRSGSVRDPKEETSRQNLSRKTAYFLLSRNKVT